MSQTKSFTFSLSRAMKVSERLIREADKHASEASRMAVPLAITLPEQVAQVERQSEQLKSALSRIAVCEQAIADIRIAIAKENDNIGIHPLLTRHKLMIRERQRLEGVLNFVESSRNRASLTTDQAVAVLGRAAASDAAESVLVNIAPDVLRDDLKAKIDRLSAQIDALLDQQNDLNTKARVTVELDTDLASAVGLV